jgi:membrane fusion protein, heavy metal efflux system
MIRILFPLFLIFIIACRNDVANQHDHEHEDIKLLITGYSDQFEVFAEADPLVVGQTSQILAHFTHLEDFKPLTGAGVTIYLATGNKGIRQTLDAPQKPGIYRFSLQPESAGASRIYFDININGNVHRIEGGNFRVYDDEHNAVHAAEALHSDHPAAISFTKEHSWVVNFRTEAVQPQALGVIIKTVGEVLPAQGDEVILSAQTRGMVRYVNNSLFPGASLENGEVLLNISGAGLAEGNATQRYQEARSNLERARANYERASMLAEERIVSQADLLQARNEYENATAVFENLSRNFSESGQQLRSPFTGFLSSIMVANGEFVEAGQPIAAVTRVNDLVIRAEVQPRYAHLLPHLADANIRFPNGNIHSLSQLNGNIRSFARSINQQNHLLPVHLAIPAQQGLLPGALLDVYLKTTSPTTGLTVPNSALVEEMGNYFVFVQLHPESFEKREIVTGITDGVHTEIIRGLHQGERIVTRGAMLVKMAAASGTIDPHSGHMH